MGHSAAVRRVLETERDVLLRRVRSKAAGRVSAEDVLQTASARALEHAAQLRDPARAEAWVARIVQNALRDALRAQREVELPADVADDPAIETAPCSCVLAQSRRLKPEYTEILRRVVLDGAPHPGVAAELGLTTNNASVRLHRARAALRKRMAEHCGTLRARSCTECGCAERGCCVD